MNIINNGKFIENIFKKYAKLAKNIIIFENLDFYRTNKKNILTTYFHCDFFGCYKEKFFCIELKETKSLEYFNTYKLNTLQRNTLEIIEKNKGISLVGIYFENINKFFLIKYQEFLNYSKSGKLSLDILNDKFEGFIYKKNSIKELMLFFESKLDKIIS